MNQRLQVSTCERLKGVVILTWLSQVYVLYHDNKKTAIAYWFSTHSSMSGLVEPSWIAPMLGSNHIHVFLLTQDYAGGTGVIELKNKSNLKNIFVTT